MCLRSAFVKQKPDQIYVHTNLLAADFTGKYWKRIQSEKALYSRIVILPIELPSHIFGQQLSKEWRLYHGFIQLLFSLNLYVKIRFSIRFFVYNFSSDIARIRTMMKYGGIYLDNDVYVVQNLDKYRKFELAVGWDDGQFLGSQVKKQKKKEVDKV